MPQTKPPSTRRSPPPSIDQMDALSQAAECLKTLAHPVRLQMVRLLLHGRYTVGELAHECAIADNLASEHLRLMQRCGFFVSERKGRRVFYRVAEPHLEQLMDCIESRFLGCET